MEFCDRINLQRQAHAPLEAAPESCAQEQSVPGSVCDSHGAAANAERVVVTDSLRSEALGLL